GPSVQITDVSTTHRASASSLTAVDLAGLTRIELAFAVVIVAASTGLVLLLGFGERRRAFVVARALGARVSQLVSFVWGETIVVVAVGSLAGILLGVGLSTLLVDVLTGVFDPPPAALAVPWSYLGLVAGAALVSIVAAGWASLRAVRRTSIAILRL